MRKNLKSLDILKYILSLFVVTIHCWICPKIEIIFIKNTLLSLISIAVPIFFIISSFLLFKQCQKKNWDISCIIKNIKRIFILYTIWSILYAVFYNSSIKTFLHNYLFWGHEHLWFLWSMLYVMPLIFFLKVKGMSSNKILILGLLAYFLNRLYTHYCSIETPPWFIPTFLVDNFLNRSFNLTGIFLATTYISIGLYLATNGILQNKKILIALFVLGGIETYIEEHHAVALGLPALSLSIFCFIYNLNDIFDNIVTERQSIALRNMSTFIYLIHNEIISIINKFISSFSFNGWLIIICTCMLAGMIFIKLMAVRKFALLNRLI